ARETRPQADPVRRAALLFCAGGGRRLGGAAREVRDPAARGPSGTHNRICRAGISGHRSDRRLLARGRAAAGKIARGGAHLPARPAGAPQPGERFRNPALARTYRELAKGGRDAFYRGRIAREVVAYSQRVGGLFSLKDFEDNQPTWVEPVSTSYRGYEVWELPPNGQGI